LSSILLIQMCTILPALKNLDTQLDISLPIAIGPNTLVFTNMLTVHTVKPLSTSCDNLNTK
jgi:hypothetical protein